MSRDSPFDVLSIDADADEEEIERAYRRRVIETHPDHGGSIGEFQAVRAAYEMLASGAWREGADEWGWEWDGNGDCDGTRDRNDGDRTVVDRDQQTSESELIGTRVEYVDYEVLDDLGRALDDDDLFEATSDAGLDASDRGRFLATSDETLLSAAERCGFTWPYACRGGACANCAVVVTDGELSMPANHVLPPEMLDQGIRLSCVGTPATDELRVVYNVKHRPDLDDLRLPPYRFERAHFDD